MALIEKKVTAFTLHYVLFPMYYGYASLIAGDLNAAQIVIWPHWEKFWPKQISGARDRSFFLVSCPSSLLVSWWRDMICFKNHFTNILLYPWYAYWKKKSKTFETSWYKINYWSRIHTIKAQKKAGYNHSWSLRRYRSECRNTCLVGSRPWYSKL